MRVANAQTLQIAKLAEKQKAEEPLPTVKKEVTTYVTNSSPSVDGEDRVFKCEHEGCASSFKTRSSLRDHQKGKKKQNFLETVLTLLYSS